MGLGLGLKVGLGLGPGVAVQRGVPVQEDTSMGGAEVSALLNAVPAWALGGRRVHDAPLLVVERVPARVGVGEVLDTGAVRVAPRQRHAGSCSGHGLGSGSGRGCFFSGSGAERVLTDAERTLTGPGGAGVLGLVRVLRKMLTGASTTPHPTGPRGPCSRSWGPTTWTSNCARGGARAPGAVLGRSVA